MSIAIQETWDRELRRGVKLDQIDLLRRQATHKFGPDHAARLVDHLGKTASAARLAEAGKWILDCDTGDDLAAQIGNGSPVNGRHR